MGKLFKSWKFNLIIAIILVTFGVVMLSPLGEAIINYLVVCALAAYTMVVISYNVFSYKKKGKLLAVLELAVIALIIVYTVMGDFRVFDTIGLNKFVGFVLWLRAMIEIAYLYTGDPDADRKLPHIRKILAYVTALSIGAALMAMPPFKDFYLRLLIGGASVLFGGVFVIRSVRYRHAAHALRG